MTRRPRHISFILLRCDLTYLISDEGFFDGSQILERGKQDMAILGTANEFDEVAELFSKSRENLVFVLDRVCALVS